MNDRKDEKDVLAKALNELKERAGSSTPPEEVVRETLAELERAELAGVSATGERAIRSGGDRIRLWVWPVAKLAVAAAILIAAGYAFGRASAPKPVDMEQLRTALTASLEPVIRKSVLEEAARDRQQALMAAYIQIKNDLTEQYRADLNRFAVQTFTASNTVTNRLLEELVQSVKVSRLQDRQLFAAALEQVETQRVQDSTQLGSAILGLAATTDTKLQRTKEDLVKLLVYRQPDASAPTNNEFNKPN
jgi:hypothetical protein